LFKIETRRAHRILAAHQVTQHGTPMTIFGQKPTQGVPRKTGHTSQKNSPATCARKNDSGGVFLSNLHVMN
jgi:hypothetical protein